MKHSIILRRRTAALLSCTLCCTCLTVLTRPAAASPEHALTAETQQYYEEWKTAYLRQNPYTKDAQYYVLYGEQTYEQAQETVAVTVSEAHGYGMLITVLMADYERKSKGRTREEQAQINRQMMDIFREVGEIRNEDPSGSTAQALVKKLQDFITEKMYTCTDEILSGLGKMYGGGGEFTKNIDSYDGEGTAVFASEAILIHCGK